MKRRTIDDAWIAEILCISRIELQQRRILERRERFKHWARFTTLIGFILIGYSLLVASILQGNVSTEGWTLISNLIVIGFNVSICSLIVFFELERRGDRVVIT